MASLLNAQGNLIEATPAELQAADEDSAILCFTSGILDDGMPYWAYIAVKPSKYSAFMAATKARQRLRMNDYGRIVRYGREASVPAEVQEEMKRDYGFDEQYVEKLVNQAEAEQDTFLKQKEETRLDDIVSMLKKKQNPNGSGNQ